MGVTGIVGRVVDEIICTGKPNTDEHKGSQ